MIRADVIARNGTSGHDEYRIPAIARTGAGTVLLAYEALRREETGLLTSTVLLRRSSDWGISWSEPVSISDMFPNDSVNPRGCPSFVVDDITGSLFLITSLHMVEETYTDPLESVPSKRQSLEISLLMSRDSGRTWKARSVTTQINAKHGWSVHSATPGHGCQMRFGPWTGRLIQPVLVRHDDNKTSFVAVCSDDEGLTWWAGNPIESSQSSCSVSELSDGRLMLRTRSVFDEDYGTSAYSLDGGRTWSTLERWESDIDIIQSDSIEPAFPGAALDTEQVHVWMSPFLLRRDGVIQGGYSRVSLDDMRTWGEPVETTTELALWPDLVAVPELRIFVGCLCSPHGIETRHIPYDDLGIGQMARGWAARVEDQDAWLQAHGLL